MNTTADSMSTEALDSVSPSSLEKNGIFGCPIGRTHDHRRVTIDWPPSQIHQISTHIHGIGRQYLDREIGGLLIGFLEETNEIQRVVVETVVPIPCSHEFGPFYRLSDSDVFSIHNYLARFVHPPQSLVGFYRTAIGSHTSLDEEDRRLADCYLTNAASIFVLIRPHAEDESSAELYLRCYDMILPEPTFMFRLKGQADAHSPERARHNGNGLHAVQVEAPGKVEAPRQAGALKAPRQAEARKQAEALRQAEPPTQAEAQNKSEVSRQAEPLKWPEASNGAERSKHPETPRPAEIRKRAGAAKENAEAPPLPEPKPEFPGPTQVSGDPAEEMPDLVIPDFPPPRQRPSSRGINKKVWLVPLAAAAVLLLVLFGIANWPHRAVAAARTNRPDEPSHRLGLTASVEGDHLRIRWNSIANAQTGAFIKIEDGPAFKNQLSLSPETLRYGSFSYYPLTDSVGLEMHAAQDIESLKVTGFHLNTASNLLSKELASANTVRSLKAPAALESAPQATAARRFRPEAAAAAPPNQSPTNAAPPASRELKIFKPDADKKRIASVSPGSVSLAPPEAVDRNYQPVTNGNLTSTFLPVQTGIGAPPPPTPAVTPRAVSPAETAPSPPKPIQFTAPKAVKRMYPKLSSPTKLQSPTTVLIRASVDADGKVTQAGSLSRGNPTLDYLSDVAVQAAKDWVFSPAQRDGKNVESTVVIEFKFTP